MFDSYSPAARSAAVTQSHLQRVFAWMFVGLALTAGVALWFAAQNDMTEYFRDNQGAFWALIIGELALVFGLSFLIDRLSAAVAVFGFCLYAGLSGVTFAMILEIYTAGSIAGAFAGAAGLFAGMAFYGYVTKRDLSSWGGILFGALIGLIVASVVFLFTGGAVFNLVLGVGGVLIFSGLTAYDIQKIKEYAPTGSEDHATKAAVIGALALYLDFVNLFLSLLRIFGSRD